MIFVVSTYCMNKILPKRTDKYHLGEILLLKSSKRLEIDDQKYMVISFKLWFYNEGGSSSISSTLKTIQQQVWIFLQSSQIESCTRWNLSVPSTCCI